MGIPTSDSDQIVSGSDRAFIEELVAEHAWLIDTGSADRLAELYTEDGVMTGVGPDLIGQAAIRQWGIGRAAMLERTSRHFCANLRLRRESDHTVRGTVLLTVYRHDGPSVGSPVPFGVAEYNDVYRLGPDGHWRFAERRLKTLFSH